MPSSNLSNCRPRTRGERYVLLCMVHLSVLLWVNPVVAQGQFVQSTWRDTIYYRATFSADSEVTALLQVAAVDSYEVFFNGRRAGSDSVWTRMSAYRVAIESGDNDIGIVVVNRGLGAGNGMMAAVVAGDSVLTRTTTNRRVQTWLWTADPQQGMQWTTAEVEDAGWELVQEGTMDTSQVSATDALGSIVPAIAGLPGSVDVGATNGSLVLGRTRGVNLALGKPSNHAEVVDGDLEKGWRTPPSALSFSADVNLQDRRLIDRVRVITKGRNAREFEEKSLRGYSVQVSDDQVRWTEVGVRHDIGCRPGITLPCDGLDVDPSQYLWTQVAFRPTWTRFVRFVIVAVSPGNTPEIGEFEVFGDGFSEEGTYLSRPLTLGIGGSGKKNMGRVRWEATVPERTELSVQFRTGDTIADFDAPETGWSEPDSSGAWFPAVEPAQMLQYRVFLATNDHNFSPEFEHLEIDYSTDIPVSRALGRVLPNRVAIGVDTTFVYNLDLKFEQGDLGVERLSIDVPSAALLDEGAAINDLLAGWESTQRTMTLTFEPPLAESVQLEIPLRARTHASAHDFRASVFSPGTGTGAGSENPLNVTENQGADPVTDEPYSWSLAASATPGDLLSGVTANPPVITPNGDRINDHTVIEFILSVVDIPTNVSIQILDLSGELVRDLNPRPIAAGVYSGPGAPGTWDGTDNHGNTVAPGLYLFRVEADLDTGNETKSGVIAVAY